MTNGSVAVAEANVRGWAVPMLYLRAPDGVTFPEHTAGLSLGEDRMELRVSVRQQVEDLHGKLVGIKVRKMHRGIAKAKGLK